MLTPLQPVLRQAAHQVLHLFCFVGLRRSTKTGEGGPQLFQVACAQLLCDVNNKFGHGVSNNLTLCSACGRSQPNAPRTSHGRRQLTHPLPRCFARHFILDFYLRHGSGEYSQRGLIKQGPQLREVVGRDHTSDQRVTQRFRRNRVAIADATVATQREAVLLAGTASSLRP